MSTIDHAAEGRHLMNHTFDRCQTDENTEALVNIIGAQVHATLALVEQQRIANDIAYVTLLERQYAEAAKNHDEFDWETRAASVERHTAVLARIREGLGL